ncbi:MAG: YlxR family protein [Chloroflexi bacterium]|nr:MAG: YlxR family protein [Chloroflexota bacterium]
MSKRSRKRKHVPQRSCVACRAVRSKRELVRIVRTPEGEITIDETGKRNGRGAYLCRQRACWETALAQRQLERALKAQLTAEIRARLREYAADLPQFLAPQAEEDRQ